MKSTIIRRLYLVSGLLIVVPCLLELCLILYCGFKDPNCIDWTGSLQILGALGALTATGAYLILRSRSERIVRRLARPGKFSGLL